MSKKDIALLHAETTMFKRNVSQAERIVRKALEVCDAWYVAFSGGKDSTVVADLVRRVVPDVPLMTSLPKWHLPETYEYLRRVGATLVASGSDHGTGWAPNWGGPDEVPDGMQWIGEKGNVKRHYGLDDVCGVFLGLRADESGRRRVHLRRHGMLFYSQKDEIWHCSPIAWWSTIDVWAYIYSRNIDYNRAYDKMDEIGIPMDEQRIGPFAVESALGYGQIAILKRGWPDVYNAFVAEHPEASLFT